ncbi:MAG: hypothetical protein E6Q28_15930 [Afipia sp.]|nr:MAG: hypothetical protein E6Q28_15930 [Afipia sp.]
MLLHTLPAVVTHNFHPDRGAFRNVCSLPAEDAGRIIASIRLGGHAYLREDYLRRRMQAEKWLIAECRRKIGAPPRSRPIYFFLGNMADGWDKSRPASIVLPLAMFDPAVITFTFPDSMTSCPYLTQADPGSGPWHGRVFSRDEIEDLIATHGFPDPGRPREQRGPDAFIEMQLWDDEPLEKIRLQTASP